VGLVYALQGEETATAGLEARLDRPLPRVLRVGRPTALFCFGRCSHSERSVSDVTIVADGVRHRPAAQRMPRPDVPECRRSGFWGTVPVAARDAPGEVELAIEATLDDGSTARAPLATIPVVEPDAERVGATRESARPLIAVCMATYDPDMELFRAQVESIRAQTDRDWICVISDDCSPPERFEEIAAVVGDDERFVLSRSDERLSFYRNFERALSMIPAEAELVALSDHDDRWYPDKLAALREAIGSGGSTGLAYSDLRRVNADGSVRGETLWDGRRNNGSNLASLLVSNTIVGASCLFHRRVVERALPFPVGPGWDFHDHWLALVALAMGDVAYVDRPLYDYVQHPRAILGRAASNERNKGRGHLFHGVLGRWRSAYFWLYLQRELHAQVLLVRCGEELSARKRRALRWMVAAQRSPLAFAWLALRPLRALAGRDETLMVEASLVRGILWRRLIGLRGRRGDASFPAFAPENLGRRQQRWLARQ
jgi:glycosyltransferase involved in cell wall biosynthesis